MPRRVPVTRTTSSSASGMGASRASGMGASRASGMTVQQVECVVGEGADGPEGAVPGRDGAVVADGERRAGLVLERLLHVDQQVDQPERVEQPLLAKQRGLLGDLAPPG